MRAILHSITFDGAHVNKSMCEKLGASFHPKNLKPFIQHPITKEKIYLFFDSCHILKLVRNALAKISILQNEQGQLIKWQYIKQLHEKEKAESLRAATKLTNKHIDFYNKIVNVRLAAQTLSESVANALIFCESIDTSFTGAVATAEFCTYFNNAFDILNSRNKFSKQPYNKSISSNTLDTYSTFIENFCHYVNSLRDMNGRKLIQCVRNRGFLGFITALRNVIELYKHLNKTYNLEYLLTYKLCQDHIENLFSSIRSCGGFNNNPSCTQF